jgi:hypothetical protein
MLHRYGRYIWFLSRLKVKELQRPVEVASVNICASNDPIRSDTVSCQRFHNMSDPGTEDILNYKTSSKLWLGKGAGGDDFVEFRIDWMVG